jgi:hemolysin activation/secretion protein
LTVFLRETLGFGVVAFVLACLPASPVWAQSGRPFQGGALKAIDELEQQAPLVELQGPATAQPDPAKDIPSEPAPSSEGGLRFTITQFVAHGNTLIPQAKVDEVLAPFTGPGRDFGTVQQALDVLEKTYAAAGFGAIQVLLPEQTLDSGTVHFMVVESRLASIRVEGNKYFSSDNYRRSLTSLQVGHTPNFDELIDNLRVINENPGKQATVVMRAGAGEGELDAVVKASDQPPMRYALTFDNTGNSSTGEYRVGAAVQYANLFDSDHVISFQGITSPTFPNKVQIFGLGYMAPIYSTNGMFSVFLGYSNVDSGQVSTGGGLYNIAGAGTVFGLRYTHFLDKRSDWEHKLSFGFDWRVYQNNVTIVDGTTKLVPDITVHPVSVVWQGSLKKADSELSAYFGFSQNLPGGNDGTDATFQQQGARPNSKSHYLLWRYGYNFQKSLSGDWAVRTNLTGQYTRMMLAQAEMFGIGGADSVRGFLEREYSNDKGHRGSLELYTPEFGSHFFDQIKMRVLGFYDVGYVKRIKPADGELPSVAISSAGLGVRGSLGSDTTFRLDYAKVIDAGPGSRGMRMHGLLTYVF